MSVDFDKGMMQYFSDPHEFHWIPPESSGLHQSPLESTEIH